MHVTYFVYLEVGAPGEHSWKIAIAYVVSP